ncbi:hypothetical protein E4K10_48375 [Streptomyces sp. T1317-0309]|nr:hypothetical protein E4K10_48375 [Streptomyces sp. T1317-0309]
MLVLTGLYLVTGQPLFLAAVYLAHFEVLEQLMPLVRLDGYYILGDLAGVPDLYGKVKPILMSLLPGRRREAAALLGLKRSARIVVTVWVAVMVPLLLAEVGYVLWNLPDWWRPRAGRWPRRCRAPSRRSPICRCGRGWWVWSAR